MSFTIKNRWEDATINPPVSKRQRSSLPDLVNRGIGLGYIGLMVVLPILAISVQAGGEGLDRLWQDVVQPDGLDTGQVSLSRTVSH
jgi:ABC-type sulfate transport system permease subunit